MTTISLSGSIFFTHMTDECQTANNIASNRRVISKSKNRADKKLNLFKEFIAKMRKHRTNLIQTNAIIKTLDAEYVLLDEYEKMEWYASLNFVIEKFNLVFGNKINSLPSDSLSVKIEKYYWRLTHQVLNDANEKFYKLTYPDSTELDDPVYLEKLTKAYADIKAL